MATPSSRRRVDGVEDDATPPVGVDARVVDFDTGLNFAFIAFEEENGTSCVEAYKKMNNVLIDDSRIRVDGFPNRAQDLVAPTMQYKGSAAAKLREKHRKGGAKLDAGHYGPGGPSQRAFNGGDSAGEPATNSRRATRPTTCATTAGGWMTAIGAGASGGTAAVFRGIDPCSTTGARRRCPRRSMPS